MVMIPGTDLDVFPLNLGGNVFGWTADAAGSFAVLDAYAAAGGDFIDTADMYSSWAPGNVGGESESIIGAWLAERGNRAEMVIATKVGKLPGATGLAPGNVTAAVDASLRRLGVDAIDLYYAHADDEARPIEEIAATFDALVRAGKVRALAASNFSLERARAWVEHARAHGLAAPVALQPRYSLVERADYEAGCAALAAELGLAVFPYSALASGFLTGKYGASTDAAGRARGDAVSRYLTPDGLAVVAELRQIAAARGVQPTSVALAWLLAKGVTAPIASASRADQVAPLVAATTLALQVDEVRALDEASAPFARPATVAP